LVPKPASIELRDVEFTVVEGEAGNLLALTASEYEDLALNQAEVLRYVREADAQLDYYRDALR
jgi:hypothetical protein